MVTVSMVVGMVLLQVTRKRTSPVRSQILPSPILLSEVTSRKNPYSLDDFLVVEVYINEGLRATPVGRVESDCSSAFRPRETPLFSVNDEFFQCLHHASWCNQHPIVSTPISLSSALFQTSCIWNGVNILRSECNFSLRERDFFVLLLL